MVGKNVQSLSTCETFEVINDATYVANVENRQNWAGQSRYAGRLKSVMVVRFQGVDRWTCETETSAGPETEAEIAAD